MAIKIGNPPAYKPRGNYDTSGKYWSERNIDGHDRVLNAVLGPRELGKTTRFSVKAWKAACLKGETCVYLTRNPTLFTQEAKEKLRTDISKFFEVPPFYMNETAAHAGDVEILCEGFPVFHIVALNRARDLLKRTAVAHPSFMWFDEFTRDTKAGDRYLKAEAERFKELYTTLVREHRGLKAYFTGNVYSLYNPYFLDWKVNINALKAGTIYTNDMCSVEMGVLTEELRKEIIRKNPFYQFDDFYSRYALDGTAKNDGDVFLVGKHPREYELRFIIRTEGKAVGIYRGPARLDERYGRYEYWVGWTTGRERLAAYAFDIAELVEGTRMASKFDRTRTSLFRLAMGARRVAFEDLACYYLLEEIYNLL